MSIRPNHVDVLQNCLHRNIVPYHLVIMLTWNAHHNIQRLTDSYLTFHLLKYVAKALLPARCVDAMLMLLSHWCRQGTCLCV